MSQGQRIVDLEKPCCILVTRHELKLLKKEEEVVLEPTLEEDITET